MTGLLAALILAAALSVAAAGVAWLCGLALQSRARSSLPGLWRSARLVALLPVLFAPLLYAVPQTASAPPALEFIDEPAAIILSHEPRAYAAAVARTAHEWPPIEWVLAAIYSLGLVVALLLAFLRHHQRRRSLTHSRIAGHHERALLDREAEKLGLRAPELRLCSSAATPFLTGWRGVIVAPETLLRKPELARHALVHELCHLRRGDERDRLIGSALAIVLWFNWPLRLIERELDAAREIACDMDAIAALGGTERKAYAATLIETMRSAAQPASAFGPHDRRHREMRIKAVLAGGRKVRHSVLTAGALLVLAIPLAGAQVVVSPRRVVSAPVDQIAPQRPQRVERIAPKPRELTGNARPASVASPAVVAEPAAAPAPAAIPNLAQRIVEGRITSHYGPRPARPAGAPVFHGGTDIAAPAGAPLSAPGSGTVTHAAMGYQGSDRWGNTVEIDHGDGWSTVYAHLDVIGVEAGQTVAAGEQIGTVGVTGAATGPHVHVELHHDGERLDPADHLAGLD